MASTNCPVIMYTACSSSTKSMKVSNITPAESHRASFCCIYGDDPLLRRVAASVCSPEPSASQILLHNDIKSIRVRSFGTPTNTNTTVNFINFYRDAGDSCICTRSVWPTCGCQFYLTKRCLAKYSLCRTVKCSLLYGNHKWMADINDKCKKRSL